MLMLALLCMIAGVVCAAPTTSVHVVKIAADGTTVKNETTVDYCGWRLPPVLGAG
jgi:hypothetical protein